MPVPESSDLYNGETVGGLPAGRPDESRPADYSSAAVLHAIRERRHSPVFRWALLFGCLGLAVRLLFLVMSGNQLVGPFSGTGDQVRYQTLVNSLLRGDGFSYAGQPTALRPPIYPLLLAACAMTFGNYAVLGARILQFFSGILLAWVCVLLARRLFQAIEPGILAGGLALAFPTLIFTAAELQTETLATLVTALFLWSLVGALDRPSGGALVVGMYSGLAALLRFNAALLPVFGALGLLWRDRGIKRATIVCAIVSLILAPWIARNLLAFHGHVLYSTHGGINLLEGVLTPQRRGEAWESGRIRAAVGWAHPDIETNATSRLAYPSEERLDQQARSAAFSAWARLDWPSRLRLLGGKVVCFWFSTDQVLATHSFRPLQRFLRLLGVMVYWVVLALAIFGWRSLLALNRRAAYFFLCYAVAVTAAHLPFVMNTRLRIPFLDPLLVVLAAGALWTVLKSRARSLFFTARRVAANCLIAS